jgi:predicted dehydrogenase
MKQPTRVAVIGCGYWGKNHVRNFASLGVLAAVCEPSPAGQTLARRTAPDIPVCSNLEELLARTDLDAVVVATPAETHYGIAKTILEAGLDVLVEKPLTTRLEEAEKLVRLADDRGRILMVGHLLDYHPAILCLRQIIESGDLGTVRYIYSNRLNLGKIRREENILWSFAPHDIAIILRLMGTSPFEVVATGGTYVQPNIADVTVTQMLFDNGVRAHIFVSWLHPYKEQRLVVVGSKKMVSFDDVSKELVIFDQHVEWQNGAPLPVNRGGTKLDYPDAEPLRTECCAFLNAIASRTPPLTDGHSALPVLDVLCAAQRSLITHGEPVQLWARHRMESTPRRALGPESVNAVAPG